MTERTYTEAEIRAAFRWFAWHNVEAFIAEMDARRAATPAPAEDWPCIADGCGCDPQRMQRPWCQREARSLDHGRGGTAQRPTHEFVPRRFVHPSGPDTFDQDGPCAYDTNRGPTRVYRPCEQLAVHPIHYPQRAGQR